MPPTFEYKDSYGYGIAVLLVLIGVVVDMIAIRCGLAIVAEARNDAASNFNASQRGRAGRRVCLVCHSEPADIGHVNGKASFAHCPGTRGCSPFLTRCTWIPTAPSEALPPKKRPKYLKEEAELIIKSLSSAQKIIRDNLGNGFNQYEFDRRTLRLGSGGSLVLRSDPQFYMSLLKSKRDRLIEIRATISKTLEEMAVALRPLYGLPEFPNVSELISPGENLVVAMIIISLCSMS